MLAYIITAAVSAFLGFCLRPAADASASDAGINALLMELKIAGRHIDTLSADNAELKAALDKRVRDLTLGDLREYLNEAAV